MSEKYNVERKNISDSQFRHVNMSGTVFEDVDLSGAKFFNINLRGANIGAVDFGGASFSCMNTGEDRPRQPVVFNSIELDDCTIQNSFFRNTKIVNCDLTGMAIDGVLVTDMVKAYKMSNSKS
ncbi:MAG: pentapeptide repeat-containing protein [Sedimentisphaerales bacterium]|nr:pentapeptide repeat-containing protein [Sedimentisphaerales bacterium]